MMSVLLANLPPPIPDAYTPPVVPPFHFHDLLWRLIGWTVFLMGLCLIVLLLSKWRRRFRLVPQTDVIRLQAVVPLSHQSRMYLVQVEEQIVAVASDAGALRTMILLSPVFDDSLAQSATDKPATSRSLEASEDSHPAHTMAEDTLVSPVSLSSNLPVTSEKKAA